MPWPGGSCAGPNSSTKMKGPTIVRSRAGQRAVDLEGAEVVGDRHDGLDHGAFDGGHYFSPGAVARIDKAWTRPSISVAERRIDHPLPFDTVLAREGRAFDPEAEMALAFGIVAAVAAVLLAVVDQLNARRRKRRTEAPEHFSGDRAVSLVAHDLYIEGFNGFETGKAARAGRRGEGAVRGPRLPSARANSRLRSSRPISMARAPGASFASTMSASTTRSTISSRA